MEFTEDGGITMKKAAVKNSSMGVARAMKTTLRLN
jgi:hypothetical protein